VGIRGYLDLARLQTAGATATVPVYGYLGANAGRGGPLPDPLADPLVLTLFATGFFAHIWGFVHNEIADRATDARAGTLRPKPLPSGQASLAGAWALALAGLVVTLGCAVWVSWRTDAAFLVLVAAACALAGAYNILGKRFAGGDALLALSIFTFVGAGAAAAESYLALTDPGVLLLAALAGSVLFFNNAFEGGYKDHASDAAGGKRTLVNVLRARGEKYGSPDGLVVLAHWPLHVLMFGLAAWAAAGPLSAGEPAWDLGRVAAAGALVGLMGRSFVRGVAADDRKRMLTFFSLHEFLAVLLLLTTLAPFLAPAHLALLLLAPLAWYVAYNRVAYGTAAAPNV